MICNIIDRREKRYRWKKINAIVEPTWHDNTVKDTDIAENSDEGLVYDERENISLKDAVKWANDLPVLVTLYLYDEGQGTTALPPPSSSDVKK